MHSRSFRRIARLFASVLLLWTAADVCDYGLCPHHREPMGSYEQTEFRAGRPRDKADADLADDCFCCSHLVDVGTPFHMALAYQFAWVVADSSPGEPQLTSVPLDHPPLA